MDFFWRKKFHWIQKFEKCSIRQRLIPPANQINIDGLSNFFENMFALLTQLVQISIPLYLPRIKFESVRNQSYIIIWLLNFATKFAARRFRKSPTKYRRKIHGAVIPIEHKLDAEATCQPFIIWQRRWRRGFVCTKYMLWISWRWIRI